MPSEVRTGFIRKNRILQSTAAPTESEAGTAGLAVKLPGTATAEGAVELCYHTFGLAVVSS